MQQSVVRRLPIGFAEFLAVLAFVGVLAVSVASWPAMGGGRPPSGIEQVYIMNADGTGLRPVSLDPNVRHATPAWSPDGRYLVMSVGGGEELLEPAHLWILDLETGETRQLTQGDARDHLPSWSPDGSTIVFIKHDLPIGSAPSTLYSIRLDGTGLTQLTDGRSQTTAASWSPDGRQLAFASDREGPWQLYLMDADGTNVQRIETGTGNVVPAWSPDGRTIAYMSGVDEGNFDVHTFDLQAGETRQLTDSPAFDGDADWSPDGSRIVFITERGRRSEVYTMNADGSDQRNLSSISGLAGIGAKWSPDGSQIVFFGLLPLHEHRHVCST
jgi:Tol biopolymer transport system component